MDLSQTDLPADFVRDSRGNTRFDCVRVHLSPAYAVYACAFFDGASHTSVSFETHTRRRVSVRKERIDGKLAIIPCDPHEYLANGKEFGRFAWTFDSLAAAQARGDKLTLHPTMRD